MLIIFSLLWFVHLPTGEQLIFYNLTFFDVFLVFAVLRKLPKIVPVKSLNIKKIFICYFILIFIGLFSLLFLSDDLKFGFYFLRSSLILPALIILFFINYIDDLNKFNIIHKFFNYSLLLFSSFLLINFFYDGFIGSNDYNLNRLGGVPLIPFGVWGYIGSVQLGSLYAIIFAFFIPYWIPKVFKSPVITITLLLVLTIIFLSGSRGAYITVCIIALIYFVGNFKLTSYINILVVTSIFFVLILNFRNDINQSSRLDTLSSLEEDHSFLYRIQMMQLGYEILTKQPQGIGFGRENRITNNEHNIYVFIGLGTGLIGLIIYLYSFFLINKIINITRKLICTEKEKQILFGGKLSIIALLINGLSDSIVMESFQSIGVFICFGFILTLCNYKIITNKITYPK
jgi:O-antigen ligase